MDYPVHDGVGAHVSAEPGEPVLLAVLRAEDRGADAVPYLHSSGIMLQNPASGSSSSHSSSTSTVKATSFCTSFSSVPAPSIPSPLAPATTSPTLCLDIPWGLAILFWDIPASRSRGTSFTLIFIAMYHLLLLGRRLTVLVAGAVSYGASPPVHRPSPTSHRKFADVDWGSRKIIPNKICAECWPGAAFEPYWLLTERLRYVTAPLLPALRDRMHVHGQRDDAHGSHCGGDSTSGDRRAAGASRRNEQRHRQG